MDEETKANKTSQGGKTQHKLVCYWLQLTMSLTDYRAFWMTYDVLCKNMWLQVAERTGKKLTKTVSQYNQFTDFSIPQM